MLTRLAAAAAPIGVMLLLAPHASAAITDLEINQGLSNGFGAGCQYTVTAFVTGDGPVTFGDNLAATFTPDRTITPTGGSATVNWIPNASGIHILSATQNVEVRTSVVQVGFGINTGSTTCNVLP